MGNPKNTRRGEAPPDGIKPRVPIEQWTTQDAYDFSDYFPKDLPTRKVREAEDGAPDAPRRGRYVQQAPSQTEVSPLGAKGAKAHAKRTPPKDSSG